MAADEWKDAAEEAVATILGQLSEQTRLNFLAKLIDRQPGEFAEALKRTDLDDGAIDGLKQAFSEKFEVALELADYDMDEIVALLESTELEDQHLRKLGRIVGVSDDVRSATAEAVAALRVGDVGAAERAILDAVPEADLDANAHQPRMRMLFDLDLRSARL